MQTHGCLFVFTLKSYEQMNSKKKKVTFAKECIISERTSESGSVPMALMSASHMKCHICVRYSGPRTLAHSRRRGIDSAAATRTRFVIKEMKRLRTTKECLEYK